MMAESTGDSAQNNMQDTDKVIHRNFAPSHQQPSQPASQVLAPKPAMNAEIPRTQEIEARTRVTSHIAQASQLAAQQAMYHTGSMPTSAALQPSYNSGIAQKASSSYFPNLNHVQSSPLQYESPYSTAHPAEGIKAKDSRPTASPLAGEMLGFSSRPRTNPWAALPPEEYRVRRAGRYEYSRASHSSPTAHTASPFNNAGVQSDTSPAPYSAYSVQAARANYLQGSGDSSRPISAAQAMGQNILPAYAMQGPAGLSGQRSHTMNPIAPVAPGSASQCYEVLAPRGLAPQPNALYAHQAPQYVKFHPAINAGYVPGTPIAHNSPAQVISPKSDSRELQRTMSLVYRPAKRISSTPGKGRADADVEDNVRPRKTINQVVSRAAATPDKCILCKIRFGEENPHEPYMVQIRLPGPERQQHWVEIDNMGAVEIAVRLPCGCVAGNNCILPYAYCPKCQGPLVHAGCGHKVEMLATNPIATAQKFGIKEKCLECRIAEHEQHRNLSTLLSRLAILKGQRELIRHEGRGEEKAGDLQRLEQRVAAAQQVVHSIESETKTMIEAERYEGFLGRV